MAKNLPVKAIVYGLEEELAGELMKALSGVCRQVNTVSEANPAARSLPEAHVIFCPPDMAEVRRLKAAHPASSVIVATRVPEISGWLDALEAGAADYCAAPFENAQLSWMIESHVRSSVVAA